MSKYCKYQLVRQKNYKPYLYCNFNKQQITFLECKNCSVRQSGSRTSIKKKSNKLAEIEKNRFSIIQDDMSICFFCGRDAGSIHELIGGINRQMSIKYGLCVGACLLCHRQLEDNEKTKQKYQKFAQEKFEKKYSHELFMQEFKMNYIAKYKNNLNSAFF